MIYSVEFQLRVVTPTKARIDQPALGARIPGAEGLYEALPRHAPIVSAVEPGELRIAEGDPQNPRYRYLFVGEGAAVTDRETTTLLVSAAESPGEIDRGRAEAAKERAQERLRPSWDAEIDAARAQAALERAEARLRVALRPDLSDDVVAHAVEHAE